MKHSWFFLSSIIFFLLGGINLSHAQESEEDAGFLSAIEVNIDALKPLSYLVDFEDKYEAGLGVFFYNKLMVSGEYGFGSLTPSKAIENGYYKSEGNYFRIGVDYYKELNPKDDLYFGFRYGSVQFFDEYQYIVPSSLWNDYKSPLFTRKGQTANWYELILGSERSYGKYLLLGLKIRIRVLGKFDQHSDVETFAIPGYGYANRPVMPAANIYLKFRLPF